MVTVYGGTKRRGLTISQQAARKAQEQQAVREREQAARKAREQAARKLVQTVPEAEKIFSHELKNALQHKDWRQRARALKSLALDYHPDKIREKPYTQAVRDAMNRFILTINENIEQERKTDAMVDKVSKFSLVLLVCLFS